MDTLNFVKEFGDGSINIMYQSGIKNTYRIHKHNFYEIFIVVSGSAVHYYNDTNYLIKTGDLVLLKPSDVHEYLIYNDDKFEMLNFACEVNEFVTIKKFLKLDNSSESNKHNLVRINNDKLNYYQSVSKDIFNYKFNNLKRDYTMCLRVLFCNILSEFYKRDLNSNIPYKLSSLINKMKNPKYLEQGGDKMIELSGFSQTHLNRQLKKYYGKSITKVILDLRLERAMELLLNTNYKIIEISDIVGFNNLSYFNRAFKEKYKYSPSEMRNYNNV